MPLNGHLPTPPESAQLLESGPCSTVEQAVPGLFFVIQSRARIPVHRIGRRLQPYLHAEGPLDASLALRLRSIWEDIRTVDGTFAW